MISAFPVYDETLVFKTEETDIDMIIECITAIRARRAEMKKNDSEIERLEKKLSNEGFVAKAPAQVIEGERAKLAKYLETRESLKTALAKLG